MFILQKIERTKMCISKRDGQLVLICTNVQLNIISRNSQVNSVFAIAKKACTVEAHIIPCGNITTSILNSYIARRREELLSSREYKKTNRAYPESTKKKTLRQVVLDFRPSGLQCLLKEKL